MSESEESNNDVDLLYTVKIQGFVKEYSFMQNRVARDLGEVSISGRDVDHWKMNLWEFCLPHLERMAVLNDGTFTMKEERPTIADADCYL